MKHPRTLLFAALVVALLAASYLLSSSFPQAAAPRPQPTATDAQGAPHPRAVLTPTAAPSPTPQPAGGDVSRSLEVTAGKVLDLSFFSESLGKEMRDRVYLPPGYSAGSVRYPVAYLLHGGGGTYTEWTDLNDIAIFADAMITEGELMPMILAMPEGDHSYFMNHATDGQRWGDYITKDFVPYIDSHYRTLADRQHRGIGGNSMGGNAALQFSFNHPEMFSAVVANSPSMFLNLASAPKYVGTWDYYAAWDPLRLAATKPGLDQLKIWLDVGSEDQWRGPVEDLDKVLTARGIDHQFKLNPGGYHWNSYWIENGPYYLLCYAAAFQSKWPGTPSISPPPPAQAPAVPTSVKADQTAVTEATPSVVAVPPDSATPLPAAASEAAMKSAMTQMIRGLRVYAALSSSPYTRRVAMDSLAGFKAELPAGPPALSTPSAAMLPGIEKAIDSLDIGAMRNLADRLEQLRG